MSDYHQTVFKTEAVDLLKVKKGEIYIDATLGGGGHSQEIIKRGGFVFGIDWDKEALEFAEKKLNSFCKKNKLDPKKSFVLKKSNFAHLKNTYLLDKKAAGALFDLGVSAHQLKKAGRGFSFLHKGPLDMRMDQNLGVKAHDLVNKLSLGDLSFIIKKYGDERRAKEISQKIIEKRAEQPIENTTELADLVSEVYPGRGRIHPATKTFQALRVAVNFEMSNLPEGIKQAYGLLDKKGRLVVISFQPQEDKLVYRFMAEKIKKGQAKKVIRAQKVAYQDLSKNPASRSALMRAWEKI